MPKRLLRSVIDFEDGKISQEHLSVNFQRLMGSNFEWTRPADQKIFEFLTTYFQDRLELPTGQTIYDFFNRATDTEVLERLKDVQAAPSYIHTNYAFLLKTQCEDQNRIKMRALVKETEEIVSKGLIIGEGKKQERLQGVRDAFQYFTRKGHELIPTDINVKTRGDIRADTEASWQEYQETKHNKGRAWGKFTGLNHIDKVVHGLKPGELWTHAAYAGELKCLPGDAWVFDHATRRRRTLKDLFDSAELPVVTALDREGATFKLVQAPTSHLEQNGVREVFDLTLTSGRTIGASDNHKFFTPDGWRELRELEKGDWVAVPRRVSTEEQTASNSLFTDADVKVLGYLLGDGHLGPANLTFTASNEAIREDFKSCLVDMGYVEGPADYINPTFREQLRDDRAPAVIISRSTGDANPAASPVRLLLDCLGLWGCSSEEKHIPDEIWGLGTVQLLLFLGALWATDGSCHTGDHVRPDRTSPSRRNDITFGSKSRRFCLDVQSLLLRVDIQSTIRPVNTTYKGEPYTFWVVRIVGNRAKHRFASCVPVVGKEDQFQRLVARIQPDQARPIPSVFLPADKKMKMPRGYFRYSNTVKRRPTVTIDEASKFYEGWVSNHALGQVIYGDLDWERVESIESRGREMTYDLSVPEHHTFVANDIVTHNTMFATNWAYQLVTRYRTNVVYFTLEVPYHQLRRIMATLHTAHPKFQAMGYTPLDYRKVRDGELTPEQEEFYQLALKDWGECEDYCHFEIIAPEDDMTIMDMRLETELLHKQFEVGMVFIDHSELVKPDSRDQSYTIRLNSVIRDAKKKFALQFNGGEGMPVCLLHQINREGRDYAAKNEGKYKMKALSYANETEKSSDIVTTTFLDDKHRENGTSQCCNLKSRDNPHFKPFLLNVDFDCRRIHNMNPMSSDDIGADGMDDMMALMEAV